MRAQITITTDEKGREWVHAERLRHHLYQDDRTQLWCVLDRNADLAVTKDYTTKPRAIEAFRRSWNKSKGRLPYYR